MCRPASGNFTKLLPTNLRWLVDEADGCAHDDPLDEVGDGLIDGQREADVQIDVVVNERSQRCPRPSPKPTITARRESNLNFGNKFRSPE